MLHVAIDDASRLAYTEILPDEKTEAVRSFTDRALAWFARHGVVVARLMSDNGSAYKSHAFRQFLAQRGVRHICTRPYMPRTNGKARRFIQRNTIEEKTAIREGRVPDTWKDKPAKLRQKDRDARWTVKFSKAKERSDGTKPPVDLAIPAFGYKNHVSIDRGFGLIRTFTTTHAAAHDGARLEDVLDRTNTASDVWADTAYRSAKNEAMLARRGFVSRIHRKKPPGRPMPERMRISNAQKSKVRSAVEHMFAQQKAPMGLVVRTIGFARAKVKIGIANLVYHIRRFVWLNTPPHDDAGHPCIPASVETGG